MVIINTPGVVLKDMQIDGDIIIAEGVGSGDVTLDSVTVSGKIIVRGGGANSIHIIGNSKIANIIIQKTDDGAVRIVTSDGAVVNAVFVDDGNDDIILTGSFENVTIAAGVTVKAVNAEIKNIQITSANATLDVDKDSKITEINVADIAIDGKITINNKGIITKATIIEGVTLNGNKPVTLVEPTTPPVANTGDSSSSGGNSKITKAEFIARISDYFAWPHPTEYNDIWKAPLKKFNDVETSDTYGKQIEVAYEENIISPDASGNFNPKSKISRQDAAVIFAKAFKIADSNKMVEFSDSTSISSEAIKSVNALVELGFMSGKTATLFAPNDLITNAEVNSIFNKITSTTVAPVQALPKQSVEYTAPRRYIKLYDPTPGATIYFTKTIATDLASMVEPAMPDINNPDQIYTVADDGHIKEDYTRNVDTYVQYKAVAVKDGMAISPVQTFTWHLYRPASADFEAVLLQEKTATSPAIYEIYNDSESVRAMAWYIEGQDKGIVFDALQTSISVKNLKDFVDTKLAKKPYSLIIGHTHGDHDAQLMNFLNAGIDVYVNELGWSSLYSSLVKNADDQAKIKNIEEGDSIDLGGGVKFDVFAMPGHHDSNIVLQDKANGLIFASDIYGCTRAGSADNVNVSGLRVDLLLSFAQQTYSNYQKEGGKTTSLFTGHDESALYDSNIKLFEAALQQVIDKGEAGCSPTLRGGNNAPYSRTTLIGDMWKDGTNWISLQLAGIMGDDTEYLSSTTDISKLPYMANNSINYNGTDGFMKYSVLSNIEIEGGELVGETVAWAPSKTFSWAGEEITVDTALENRFNPWSYDYTINVPQSNESIKIIPTTMSTKVKSIKLNGKEIKYRSSNNVPVSDGTVITISIIAPDNITTSTYNFTIRKETVTKAEFIAKISDYFAWPHPTEYNDIWKAPLKQFNDVETSDTYGKQIEVAYEENIISPDASGNFNPESKISRQDAAVIFAKAFKIADSNKMVEFSDRTSISAEAIKSVNAIVELGYMSGKTATLFAPDDLITNTEVNSIFNKITSTAVAPVQALPKQTVEPYTAPRRFIKLYTPTDGAKIYYTKASSIEGWPTVEDPTTSSAEYVLAVDGHISELVGSRSGELDGPDNYVVYKAIAVKDGKVSPVQTFKWHLNRPMDGEFLYEQLKEKTATSPAVYEIFRNNESVRAMAWYMEGADSGIIFDALQTPADVKNLKTFIDENLATKPYIAILGHEHGDHDAQIPNFINGNIDVYANQRGWAAIGSPGGFGAVVTTPEAQAKVKNVEEGMTFDLGGGTVFEVYALPGHANGNVGLYDRQSGYLFASDFYGCTRAGSADTVGISGVRADLLLSFVQQVYGNYTKDGSEVTALFTGHDESELSDINLQLFEAALQQVIDNGEDGCTPSVRGTNNRTTMIGNMYEDGTNWIALELGGKMGDDREYLSSTTDLSVVPYMSDPENNGLNYNAGGNVKYSVLSNIEIEGGVLVGKTVQWAKDADEFQWNGEAMTVNPSLENRFNPWSYDYTINVPESNESITIIPTTMSTKVKSIKLNGKEIKYRSSNNVPVSDGTVITISIIAPDNITTSTYSFTVKKGNAITAKDFNDYTTNLVTDYSQATQLPLTGYYTKAVGTDRSVKVYIPENASIRAKFTAITVPEGVDTYSFLDTQGWISKADENGECLFVLEPGENGWGSQAEENDYINNAMKSLATGKNDNNISVFSTYGAFYLVGYDAGCAPLEAWAANNPIFVNTQVYINGTSVGQEYLDTIGAKQYNGKNTGGYDPGQDDEDFTQTLKDMGYDGTFITQSEVPVPTWFIGYDENSYSIAYWKNANDVVSTPVGEVYYQDINSDAWQTQYANESILTNNPDAQYGMSQVKVSESADLDAENIFKFNSNYIRYTTTFAYSNHLEYRLDYGKMLVDLQKKAAAATITSEVYNMPDGVTGNYDFYAQDDIKVTAYDNKTGTVISGIVALTDYNGDGNKDPRDYIVYVPDSAEEIWGEQGAPVVMVNPGMTQTASVFMDASMWWQVANDEGCVIAIVGEAYSSATGVSYKSDSTEFSYMLESIIGNKISNYVDLDLTRIYGSGHSLGCRTIQDLAMSNPDLMAAVSSTSFPPSTTVRTGEMMPNYFIHGQSDLPFELPDLWGNTMLQDWANYFFEANGLNTDIDSYDSSDTSGRFQTYVWNNSQDIPLVKYGYTLAREHNCMPQEFTMGWDFLEHYSFAKDANGHVTARYYSPSGFINNDDAIQILKDETNLIVTGFTALTAVDLNADEHLVDLAALKDSGKLPTTVEVATVGKITTIAAITGWTGDFDGTVEDASYTLTAVWTMPVGYVDATTPIAVTETINVKEAQTVEVVTVPFTITSYTLLNAVDLNADENMVDLAALIAGGKLPITVEVTDGTTTTSAAITGWTGTFDGTTTGTYTLTAVWTMPEGYSDATTPIAIKETVNVTVAQTK